VLIGSTFIAQPLQHNRIKHIHGAYCSNRRLLQSM